MCYTLQLFAVDLLPTLLQLSIFLLYYSFCEPTTTRYRFISSIGMIFVSVFSQRQWGQYMLQSTVHYTFQQILNV
jgi:hypothetical protein